MSRTQRLRHLPRLGARKFIDAEARKRFRGQTGPPPVGRVYEHPWVGWGLARTPSSLKRWHRATGNRALRRIGNQRCGQLVREAERDDALFPLRAEHINVWEVD